MFNLTARVSLIRILRIMNDAIKSTLPNLDDLQPEL